MRLESYIAGGWVAGQGEARPFVNPTTGETLGEVCDGGIDVAGALDFARREGTAALSALSFAERGNLLRAVADVLTANREKYADIARRNSGNTPTDAAIDIDGGIATLKVYARYGKTLGDARTIMEAGEEQLAKEPVFYARHLWTTRPGVALQINAFNFPSWGLWEKVSTALLAGVASVAKPASATAWLSNEMVRDVIAADVLPKGALSLVCGRGAGLVDHLGPMDSLAFTGSADTGLKLKSGEALMKSGARVTIEADSVNATIVGPDAAPGTVVFDLAVREAVKALSVKAGQLCTNIRRVFVSRDHLAAFEEAVAAKLGKITVGDPALATVRMGPLVDAAQRDAALQGIATLAREAKIVTGGEIGAAEGADAKAGAFLQPTLLRCDDAASARAVHETEVFGPCATVMAYDGIDQAAALAAKGEGSLALSLFSNDADVQKRVADTLGPWHGRMLLVDETVGKNHTGHSIVMPQCVHGGPGRAGGGEELGGLRGLRFHMQRSAVQGSPALMKALSDDAAEAAL
ncbi:3,4-dehydroadipyl-CoA semialdehyde dehydrogenase [Pararhizobium haloflavum]|uniref:3,4-dehydroadipyl-CoA semialdehyde dehydrogenase n=1 Tax=Pararhizobium haloflavum TaxID=2037914 RepID=UPI000C19E64C|nr:3,4-dehydroadipyl-CoA semialdehyde dehydrogenase [Pararhizobium haloflavum]